MAFIAATAAGLALDRLVWSDIPLWSGGVPQDLRDLMTNGIILSVPLAAMWTFTTLALQLRHPRYPLRRSLRQPGMAACCAATMALALGCFLVACSMQRRPDIFSARIIMGFGLPAMAGSAVTAVWTLAVLLGAYRASSDWLDRLGRLLGLYWMTSVLALGWTLTG